MVTVKLVNGQQDVYELSYQLDPKDDPNRLDNRVLVDASEGWGVTRHEHFFPNGKSARLMICDYKTDDSGLWVSTRGQFRDLWGKDVPDLDWRFAVRRCVVNDSEFDESVIGVKLSKGTFVTDNRYRVSYRVGEGVMSGSDLTHLALKAREAENARRKPEGIAEDASGRSAWLRRVLTGTAVLLVLIRRRMVGGGSG